MNIVIYSTNPNFFDSQNVELFYLPKRFDMFSSMAKKFTQHRFFAVLQKPSLLLCDPEAFAVSNTSENSDQVFVKDGFTVVLTEDQDIKKFCKKITDFNPDIAVAASFWQAPYDWLMIKDSLVSENLRAMGINTVCNSKETCLTFFDKWQTYTALKEHNFNVTRAVHIGHELFWAERTHKESVISNPYKQAVLEQVKQMRYPVVIKDPVGLSSYQMEVCKDYGEASNYLLSKKNSSDRLVEEYISGMHCGLEIHGIPGNYRILPPFCFTTNKYGITSPKQSVKAGPLLQEKYNLEELNKQMLRLAETFEFQGIVQVDLIFTGSLWYIVEVNPRMSGMTAMYSIYKQQNVLQTLLSAANMKDFTSNTFNNRSVLNIKYPILTQSQIEDIYKLDYVEYISQIHNTAARQERERGYCEVILAGKDSAELTGFLLDLQKRFPDITESEFVSAALDLLK